MAGTRTKRKPRRSTGRAGPEPAESADTNLTGPAATLPEALPLTPDLRIRLPRAQLHGELRASPTDELINATVQDLELD
eukprot:COSAG03_NODE_9621_length_705_cov_1.275578_1_plen_78_part_10